jgi:hypothetical protein
MENRLGLLTRFAAAAGSAVLAAFALGHVAHDDIGLSELEIRHAALIGTVVIAMLVAIKSFRSQSR